jgi:DNA-binding GntR family transcriptional regulator
MTKRESNVDRVYEALRQMAADFAFKPDQRINESALADVLGASRTPLREAINRGFFCRPLTPGYILDLYEARVAVECEALRLACLRAPDSEIAALSDYLDRMEPDYQSATDPVELLALDESFHNRLVQLSGNSELLRLLKNLNGRIRYIRLIDLKRMRDQANGAAQGDVSAHQRVLEALAARDVVAATDALRSHIEKRREEATEAVRIAFSQLYVPDD